ncbi:MAG: hypothetical protein RDV48_00340 [Candidatus Eremiobacteraeota bacterium]|nr:hypothetical protein [Candidatus Eremiobacteraeota bacterium]
MTRMGYTQPAFTGSMPSFSGSMPALSGFSATSLMGLPGTSGSFGMPSFTGGFGTGTDRLSSSLEASNLMTQNPQASGMMAGIPSFAMQGTLMSMMKSFMEIMAMYSQFMQANGMNNGGLQGNNYDGGGGNGGGGGADYDNGDTGPVDTNGTPNGKANLSPSGGWAGTENPVKSLVSLAGKGFSVTSAKRGTQMTASGNVSDHYIGNKTAYANDVGWGSSTPTASSDSAASRIVQALGGPANWGSKGGVFTKTINGIRYQVLYRTNVGGNHFNHIHIGAKRV